VPRPPAPPELAEIACWRLVPTRRPSWQPGQLRHDPDLGGWSWDDGIGPDDVAPDVPKAYWTPPLLDAHTHMGDAFLRPERARLPRDLVALVAPPNGYKHRRLQETDADTIRSAIHDRARLMTENGTIHALDFREGGADGIRVLGQGIQASGLGVTALGRPARPTDDADAWIDELDDLMGLPGVGIGLSSLTDLPGDLAEKAADACRRMGRPLALHLSERIREDTERAVTLDPVAVVHLNQATERDLVRIAEANILAVSCPISNEFFGIRPPLQELVQAHHDHGLEFGFGTDNAMLSDGDLKDEAKAMARLVPEADLDLLLRALTWTPWKAIGGPPPDEPGVLWGIHPKVPRSHPEETPLFACGAVLDPALHAAPRL
jgi:cytosine/adenosine deaminase-related metal-dependent hydrolase